MRLWARLALIVWLLAGLISAPAFAFGMACHGGADRAAVNGDMPMTMPMAHHRMPHSAKDMEQKAFSCAVHCLSAGAGFILADANSRHTPAGKSLPAHFTASTLHGLTFGPPLEPPISALV
jgi:hypothetical protein